MYCSHHQLNSQPFSVSQHHEFPSNNSTHLDTVRKKNIKHLPSIAIRFVLASSASVFWWQLASGAKSCAKSNVFFCVQHMELFLLNSTVQRASGNAVVQPGRGTAQHHQLLLGLPRCSQCYYKERVACKLVKWLLTQSKTNQLLTGGISDLHVMAMSTLKPRRWRREGDLLKCGTRKILNLHNFPA